jgi:EF-hand domain-containing protein 1
MARTAQGIDLSGVPNLPGYGIHKKNLRRVPHGRSQGFALVNGVRIEQSEGLTFEKPKFVKVPLQLNVRRIGSLGESTMQADYQQGLDLQQTDAPAWDVLDRHVLRFYGHFQEAVVEANLENHRIRNCVICYYLEDDTCHITEKKQDNSGIPQGQLIRRHRFPGPSNGYLAWEDLQVGGELHIYGRVIFITSCDIWTRSFYEQAGCPQEADMAGEEDSFASTQVKMAVSAKMPRSYEKVYRETIIGGGHINADMQQFMEWDKKVCRFYAVYDDLSLPSFERRPFELFFYLSNDTVEIREKYPLNCGREHYPIFFRRAKLARGKVQVLGPMVNQRKKEDMVSLDDFAVGITVELLGQPFFIYDADEFTRNYYQQERGQTLADPIDVRLPERTVPKPKTPPYTGYGTWEDSMGSVNYISPKPPKPDFVKLYKNEGKILRFTAQFYNPKPEDQDRMFIFNFHLFDDTLSIHEPPQRNLGILTGKFLEKGIHLNQNTGNLFAVEDFMPGSVVKIYNREFEILDMDEYTRKFLEEGGVKREFHLQAVLEKIREGMRQQYPLARDVFRKFDSDKDGVLTKKEFQQALAKFGFQVSEEEALIIMKHFDSRKDGQISFNEFCDTLLDEDYTTGMLKQRAPLEEELGTYGQLADEKLEEREETEKVRAAVRAIGDVVYRHSQTFMRLLKDFARVTHTNFVTCEQITESLEQIGKSFALEDVQRCVSYVLPEAEFHQVAYVPFLKAVVSSYHDLSGKR